MVYIRSVAVWIRDMRTPPEAIAASESERLARVEAGAAAVVKRRAEAALPYGFWTNTPVLKQTHTTAVAGAAAGRGTADYAHLIEALKTDALGKEQGADGK